MFKWIEDLLGSNHGQGRIPPRPVPFEKECCGKCKDNQTNVDSNRSTYTCSMPGDVTATPPTPSTNPPLDEEPDEPFTVSMYLATGTEISVSGVTDWLFEEDATTGRVDIELDLQEDKQVYTFLRGQLSYVTAI